MQLGNKITLKQTQNLVLTPDLKQSIQILQYNQVELKNYIDEALLSNPVLQVNEPLPTISDEKLLTHISRTRSEHYPSYDKSGDDEMTYEQTNDTGASMHLTDYLQEQLCLQRLSPKDSAIAHYILGHIDDESYLDIDLEYLCLLTKSDMAEVEAILTLIQSFDPIGIGSRSLQECLQIQLNHLDLGKSLAYAIVSHSLDDLGSNRLKKIAKDHKVSLAQVIKAKEIIQHLDPKPMRVFSEGDATEYILPDIILTKVNDDYHIELSDHLPIPRLWVSPYYQAILANKDLYDDASKYIQDKIQVASNIIRHIEQRNTTIRRVAEAIVAYQEDFFDKGHRHLKAMTLQRIADDLGLHESTVSRATAGKYLQCQRGLFELKYFFQSGLVSTSSEMASSESVKGLIDDLIKDEDAKKPLSDQTIADCLKKEGITISRRTVAKYRDALGIPSSSKRKSY